MRFVALLLTVAPLAVAAQPLIRCDSSAGVVYQATPCTGGAQERVVPAPSQPTDEQRNEAFYRHAAQSGAVARFERAQAAEQLAAERDRLRRLQAEQAQLERQLAASERRRLELLAEQRHRDLVNAITGSGFAPPGLTQRHRSATDAPARVGRARTADRPHRTPNDRSAPGSPAGLGSRSALRALWAQCAYARHPPAR